MYKDRNDAVLDDTIVLYGGANTTHSPRNLLTLMAEGANMAIDHGVYWTDGETQIRTMGVEQELFADCTGTL